MIKGCTNPNCNSQNKEKQYSQKEFAFCPECGMQLSHVCKNCNTVLTDDSKKLCIRCEQEKQDKKDKRNETLRKASGAVAGVAGIALAAVPGVGKIVKK